LVQLWWYCGHCIRHCGCFKATLLAEERLAEYEFHDEAGEYASSFLVGLRKYKDELCSDIAMAASLVDVGSWADQKLLRLSDCKRKLFEYIRNFELQYDMGEGFADRAEEQFLHYLNGEGVFATFEAKRDARNMSSRSFFDKYDATIPDFACAALHLSSKGCGSGDAERCNKETKFIYSKAQNRMGSEKRDKLLLRYNILANRYGTLDNGLVDPRAEIVKYGKLEEELVDLGLTQAEPELDANDEIRCNAFKAYLEDGEEEKIKIADATGRTARFELLDKYRDMLMLDNDETPPEYRKIVDLEWLVKKPSGWQAPTAGVRNSWKQWQVVTELIPSMHQDQIDNAGGIAQTRQAYFINYELFSCIIAVPSSMQPRPVEEESTGECDDLPPPPHGPNHDEEDEDSDAADFEEEVATRNAQRRSRW
jgi:hypothetical protein